MTMAPHTVCLHLEQGWAESTQNPVFQQVKKWIWLGNISLTVLYAYMQFVMQVLHSCRDKPAVLVTAHTHLPTHHHLLSPRRTKRSVYGWKDAGTGVRKQSVFYRQQHSSKACQGLRVPRPFKAGVFKCGIYIKQAKVSVLSRPHTSKVNSW